MNKNNAQILLISARSLSTFGNVLFDLFIAWTVYKLNHNIMNTVYVIGGSMLFRAAISIFTGILSDRFNRKRISIICELGCGISILLVFLLLSSKSNSLLLYFLLVILNDIFQTFLGNAFITWTSDIFDEADFIKFQSRLSVINRVIVIGGSAVAGTLLNIFSPIEVVFIDTATFLFSAFLMSFVIGHTPIKADKNECSKTRFDFSDVIIFIKENILNNPTIYFFIIILFTLNLSYGYIPYILPIKIASLHLDNPTVIGLMKSLCSVGEILGLVLATKYSKKFRLLFSVGLIGSLCSIGLLYVFKVTLILIYSCFFFYGVFDSMTQPYFSYLIKNIDSSKRGRILGIIDTIILMSPGIGMWIGTKLDEINFGYTILFLCSIFAFGLLVFTITERKKQDTECYTLTE